MRKKISTLIASKIHQFSLCWIHWCSKQCYRFHQSACFSCTSTCPNSFPLFCQRRVDWNCFEEIILIFHITIFWNIRCFKTQIQCPPFNRITSGRHKSVNNNRLIQLTDVYYFYKTGLVIFYCNKRLILHTIIRDPIKRRTL